jgi:Asp-tRNA(Asn)/Glu-tRNA(Gln) amidotransferase A subunit family amidase
LRYLLFASCFIFIAILSSCSSRSKIKRHHIRAAQKINGLSFSRKELKTMAAYLNDNRKGYDSMRAFPLAYEVTPAMYFDPRPDYFQFKKREKKPGWKYADSVELPTTDEAIAFMTVAQLSTLIKAKKLTSTRLTNIYLARIKKFKDTLSSVVTVTEELALKQAKHADEEMAQGKYRGPLHGIPYGIKDLFAVPGYKTTWGAEPYQNQALDDKAEVVRRLEEAGAVLVAKLVSGALARGDVWFGGKTKNPWDLTQGASGSSAGSASSTSAGLVAFSIGTETLGSILAPSTRCGTTGFRPSFGGVSRAGAMTLSWSMDKAGPICRTAQDCAIVFEIIRGKNPKGELDRAVVDYDFSFSPPENLKAYKIGYTKELFDKDTTRGGVNNAETIKRLTDLGADLKEMKFPDKIPYDVFDIILRAEAGAYFDELVRRHGERELSEQDPDSRANSLRQARFIPAAEYLQANRYRKVLIEKFNVLMKEYDFIVVPASGKNHSLLTNLTGHPAISIPTGWDKKGRPTSVILIGNLYDDAPILEAAYVIQQATDFEEKHPVYFYKESQQVGKSEVRN